jgi:hypothetical protein
VRQLEKQIRAGVQLLATSGLREERGDKVEWRATAGGLGRIGSVAR